MGRCKNASEQVFIYSFSRHLVLSRAGGWGLGFSADQDWVLAPPQCSHSRGRWTYKHGSGEGNTGRVLECEKLTEG